jgi:hypothetical protein
MSKDRDQSLLNPGKGQHFEAVNDGERMISIIEADDRMITEAEHVLAAMRGMMSVLEHHFEKGIIQRTGRPDR